MQKNFFQSFKFKVQKRTNQFYEPQKNWWERFFNKMKQGIFWNRKKTTHLRKKKSTSRIIPFTQPLFKVEVKRISFNSSIEPSIDIVFLAKETSRIQIFLRDTSKNI